MASVGQTSRQARQRAAMRGDRRIDGQRRDPCRSRRERTTSPRWRSSRFVCLPIQPKPASRASGFSSTGALSTKTRWPHRPDARLDARGEPLEPAAQDLVIVAAERVARDVGRGRAIPSTRLGAAPGARAGSRGAPRSREACPARALRAACAFRRAGPYSPSRRADRARAIARAGPHPRRGRCRRSRPSGSRARRRSS